jgi:hypothetical protein
MADYKEAIQDAKRDRRHREEIHRATSNKAESQPDANPPPFWA